MTFLLLALFSLQTPGDGWKIVESPPREVKRVYWELYETTEVWLRILPEGPQGKPPLINLIFQAHFAGRAKRNPYTGLPQWPKGEPERLAVTAHALPLTLISGAPTLRLVIDGNTIDLTGQDRKFRYLGSPAVTGVDVEIEPALLESLMTVTTIQGQALGFPIKLSKPDQLALAEFAKRIGLSAENAVK